MERVWQFAHCRVRLVQGDIADMAVDAVVNPANNELWMGGGVAGALRQAGGRRIEAEAVANGPVPPGEALVTGGGRLPARYVIHAVTMEAGHTADRAAVARAMRNALNRCVELGVYSVAFPAMGAGAGSCPAAEAAGAMFDALLTHLAANRLPGEVTFVFRDADTRVVFFAECARRAGVMRDHA